MCSGVEYNFMREGWGKPPFAKKWHFFKERGGSACGSYDMGEAPEELLVYPGDFRRICDQCLLRLARRFPEALVVHARKTD